MANAEQLEILRQGTEAWNKWRAENPDLEVNLSGATLWRPEDVYPDLLPDWVNLIGANLSSANLYGAHLDHAYLMSSDLTKAILIRANLSGALLSEANLQAPISLKPILAKLISVDALCWEQISAAPIFVKLVLLGPTLLELDSQQVIFCVQRWVAQFLEIQI
jgi:hypothetical protein